MSGKVAFTDAHHFTCINPHQPLSRQRWYCNLCSPAPSLSHHYMSKSQAITHEKKTPSHNHKHSHLLSNGTAEEDCCGHWWYTPDLEPSAWDPEPSHAAKSLAELKAQASGGYETCSSYLIPFWRDALSAAERGEELKLEAFMERKGTMGCGGSKAKAKAKRWGSDSGSDDWGGRASEWAREGVTKEADWGAGPDLWGGEGMSDGEEEDFVEAMASRFHAGPKKKQAMRCFYQMSTTEKVQAIQEMARDIRQR